MDAGIFLRGSKDAVLPIASAPGTSGRVSGHAAAGAGTKAADRPAGGWNRFVVTVKGDTCTVTLNGQTVAEHAKLNGLPARGPIGLKQPTGAIEFANLYVRELRDGQ